MGDGGEIEKKGEGPSGLGGQEEQKKGKELWCKEGGEKER